MDYIKRVSPLPNYFLEVEMANGSSATVDFKPRFNSARYMALKNEEIFKTVSTDGNYVIWQNGLVKITAKEVLGVLLEGGE
jgi:two-component system chemotaxis response regulator CheY